VDHSAATIAALKQRAAELEEEVRWLRGDDAGPAGRLAAALGVTGLEARYLLIMARRPELTNESAYAALYGARADADQPKWKILAVMVCHLRARLPKTIRIETKWGRGYFLGPDARAQVLKLAGDGVTDLGPGFRRDERGGAAPPVSRPAKPARPTGRPQAPANVSERISAEGLQGKNP